MLKLPVANERGERLLSVDMPPRDDLHDAFDFALIVARCDDRLLLVHNRRRDTWELPGGFIDAGEGPEACARRELLEESGQAAGRLSPAASLVIERPDGTLLRGLAYTTRLRHPVAFAPNAEIDAIGFWPPDDLPHPLSAIDAHLVQRVM